MLEITIAGKDNWDPEKEEFVPEKPPVKLRLEHSLLSLAKWESKWHKPYLSQKSYTSEEFKDYVRCMTITQHVDPEVYDRLSRKNMEAIKQYIDDPYTATKIYDLRDSSKNIRSPRKKNIQTSETIYASMFEFGIPIEFEKRHLNHLLMLLRVCQERMSPSPKMSKAEQLAWQRAENNRRRAKTHSRG